MRSSEEASGEDVGSEVVNQPVDHDWLNLVREEPLEPDRPIVDAHHHMWDRLHSRYMPMDVLADVASGHNIVATVYIEAGAMYRSWGPNELRPVGETEIVATFAETWPADGVRICDGIVGHVDLMRGSAAKAVMEAHIEAGRGHFRGVRQNLAWDPSPLIQLPPLPPRGPIIGGMMSDARFREAFACLAPLELSFEAWLYQPQLPELLDLARAFPETSIILNHVGGPVRVGPYRGEEAELFAEWRSLIRDIARCTNVAVKIGGMGMRTMGFDFRGKSRPPTSEQLAALWGPYAEVCIEAFGAERSMFESNFPVDKAYYSYEIGWNAFKRIAASASETEKNSLFRATASRVYRLREDH